MVTASASALAALKQTMKRLVPAPWVRTVRRAQRAASYVPRRLLGTVTCVITQEPAVALTFDDGPDPQATPRILEALEAGGARGTFFLVGRTAQRRPDLVRRIVAGGHAIGNHSWDHYSFPQLRGRERREQIRAWARAFDAGPAKLFRPPYGNQTLLSRLDPLRLGWEVVAWSICANDWRGESGAAIAERILERLRPGSVVLLHDSLSLCEDFRFASRDATVRAVELVLEAAGPYRFVTVPELLRLGTAHRELWHQPGEPEYLAGLQRIET